MRIRSDFPEVVAEIGEDWRLRAPANGMSDGIACVVNEKRRLILPEHYPDPEVTTWLGSRGMNRLIQRADNDFRNRHRVVGEVATRHFLRFRAGTFRARNDGSPHTDIDRRAARSLASESRYWIAAGSNPDDPEAPPAVTKFYQGDFIHLWQSRIMELRWAENLAIARQCRGKEFLRFPEDTLVVSDAAVVHQGPGADSDFPNIVLRDDVQLLSA